MKITPRVRCVCKCCGKIFLIKAYRKKMGCGVYCSIACHNKMQFKRVQKKCLICKKTFFVLPSGIKRGQGKYCSTKCRDLGANNSVDVACKVCGKKTFHCKSRVENGVGKYCSTSCWDKKRRRGVMFSCKTCGKIFYRSRYQIKDNIGKYCSEKCWGISERGCNAPNWKGGATEKVRIFRTTNQYKHWRNAVLERDNFTCQKCGVQAEVGDGVLLHAHHIKLYSLYPELRVDVKNGITYCGDCHEKEHGFRFPLGILGRRVS